MQRKIKKQNELLALRVLSICKNSIQSIEWVELMLMKLSNVDSSIFQVLEGYKAEINHLAKTNFDHIEECTGDSILVDPVLLDGLKTSTNVVVKKVEKLLETLNRNEPDKDRQNFILNSYSTDYIIN